MTITATSLPTSEEQDGTVKYARVGSLELEAGGFLPDVVLAYETWGKLNADASNAVLVEHALTGSTHVARGASDEEGWWEQLVGPGATIDTNRFFVISINIVGGCYGSTGPSSQAPDGKPWGSRFPLVTLRDSTVAEARLADALGIRQWHAVLGGSMGGARALEWAVTFPNRVERCAVISVGAYSTAEQIAFAQAQTLAIRQDPNFNNGDYYHGPAPETGLALARRIAHITYRSALELDLRFGREAQPQEKPLTAAVLGERGRYQVESYLDHQGTKLVRRFDANSYIAITEALMSHDVRRGRGPLKEALSRATAQFFVAAVNSDRLYFPAQSHELAEALPGDVPVHIIEAPIGHDGFLTEIGQLAGQLGAAFFAEDFSRS
ncbi:MULTISPECIES: homoserine O-acetyltransferase [Paenarthrobacter]|uniref:Homoserine O-acetyltransferase n=1 Tax=Paenarthrobacter ureafaciens TaxID=37931 RepID=A0AAX3ENI5_PAEUR|nr:MULTISPECIES: homoserine O-acetyltransferase [Paenarthrobacter]NKR12176.1 homoserine O-acetyltransferase [Arthrobacter sp. M5]NKR18088.1 homoserine O-acetyltransferase [Arthrobacter sp. M6]OEH57272.1 homoserine O-acetyltransferase [Arthrobacter sp. D2]OEH64921.1 homoserine O-acetyltransferase [Arthrobacter sp. D4]MDO5864020.1 homoserine O-acetyltransferase [Paenarthrobacter sp. SD-2]